MNYFDGPRQLEILLAEDSDGDAALIRHLLSQDNCSIAITRVVRLRDAMDRLQELTFDAVLLDLNLPDAVGPPAVRAAVSAAGPVPVVVLTGFDEELARRCLEAGAEDYIEKSSLNRAGILRSINHARSRAKTKALMLKLQQSHRLAAIGQLAAGVAHEVNNPAASMLLNMEALGRDLDDMRTHLSNGSGTIDSRRLLSTLDEMERTIAETLDSVGRIASVTKELKTLSRSSELTRTAVELHEVCRTAARLAQGELAAGAQLSLDLAEVTIESDRAVLLQLVVNIIQNAAQALEGRPSGFVRIRVERDPSGARITVSDSGRGIPEAEIAQVFNPFYSTKSPTKHPGLGLSMCAEFVHRLGGEIDLQSEEGVGTRVVVTLPHRTALPLEP